MSTPEPFPGTPAYRQACACDAQGLEAEAIPHYERALAAGLAPEDRRGALLGLGSSLRNVGRHPEAVQVLTAAVAEFPGYPALACFRALAEHTAGRPAAALATLLDVALAHVDLDGYGRALAGYRQELAPDGQADHQALVRGFLTAIQARDWAAVEAALAPDATMTWWATGERFAGAAAIVAVNATYPEGWTLHVERIDGTAEGGVHAVVRVDHPPDTFFANARYRFADGRIATIDEWWATAEDPPAWRRPSENSI